MPRQNIGNHGFRIHFFITCELPLLLRKDREVDSRSNSLVFTVVPQIGYHRRSQTFHLTLED